MKTNASNAPDPSMCEKIGGKLVKKMERKKMPNGQTVEREKEITEGGILHWGRETENKETLEWFRQEIKKAYGGRAPKLIFYSVFLETIALKRVVGLARGVVPRIHLRRTKFSGLLNLPDRGRQRNAASGECIGDSAFGCGA